MDRLGRYRQSAELSAARPRATKGSLDDMVRFEAGSFLMGSEAAEASPSDGEGPVRLVTLQSFYISKYAVTNRQFAAFVRKTAYVTEAERFGWSFVFRNFVPERLRGPAAPGAPWWVNVAGASWSYPDPIERDWKPRPHHPVVHVSWNDAQAYCSWAGYRQG